MGLGNGRLFVQIVSSLLIIFPGMVSAGGKVTFDPSVLKSKANVIKEKIRVSKNDSIDIIRRGEYIRAQNSMRGP